MQIGKSFTYAFEDAKWATKLLLGALIAAVPILNFAFVGYLVDIIRRVSRNELEPLPGWDDLGKKFMDGLILTIAGLIYAIPLFLFGIPFFGVIFSAAMSGDADLANSLMAASAGVGILFGCLAAIYILFLTLFSPAMYVNFARKGNFGACFEIGKIIKVASSNFGNYLLAWLMAIVAGLVIGLVGGILSGLLNFIPCIGQILSWLISAVMSVLIGVVYAHLFGQVSALNT